MTELFLRVCDTSAMITKAISLRVQREIIQVKQEGSKKPESLKLTKFCIFPLTQMSFTVLIKSYWKPNNAPQGICNIYWIRTCEQCV